MLEDAACEAAIVHPDFADVLGEAVAGADIDGGGPPRIHVLDDDGDGDSAADDDDAGADDIDEHWGQRNAMMVYTSGTTGRPKGVVATHANLEAQMTTLVDAWGWTPDDRIANVLPLHHVHGIVNVVGCALWSGATVEMPPAFDAAAVWDRFAEGGEDGGADALTLFMAVPTVYSKLVEEYERRPPAEQARLTAAAARLRLMVCGSAALPVTTLATWKAISGHTLLERYGAPPLPRRSPAAEPNHQVECSPRIEGFLSLASSAGVPP